MGNDAVNPHISKGPDGVVDWNGNERPYNNAGGGNGGGFVGFNPEAAQSEINKLEQSFGSVLNLFRNAHVKLFGEEFGLVYVWCSPNAVKFGETYSEKIDTLYNKLMYLFVPRIATCKRAYNIIANRNQLPPIYSTDAFGDLGTSHLPLGTLLEKHPNGAVGINPSLAPEVKKTYMDNMADCSNAMKSVPTYISFYDEGGAQQQAFENKLEEIKKEVDEIINDISAQIDDAIATEVHNDLLAKQQVVTTLNA